MPDKITSAQLHINCRFHFLSIRKCRIHAGYGEHTTAELGGTVKGEEAKKIFADAADDKIEIYKSNEDGSRDILFIGMIREIKRKEEGGYTYLSLKAVSNTWKMDIAKKSRSFQNMSMTYQDVVKCVLNDYAGILVWNLPDKRLEHPLIQYQETDFQFLKRILSYIGAGITSGDSTPKVCIEAGIRRECRKGKLDIDRYAYSLITFQNENAETLSKQRGYEIADIDYLKIGDGIRLLGKDYYVMETDAVLVHDVLHCTGKLFPKQCFEVKKNPALTLAGAVLTGKVLETRQEEIKLHLDIDREQVSAEAYEFPWKPITGNFFYGMPEIGSKAALYFGREEESQASVIYCIRENGEEEWTDYDSRCFTTQKNKRMYLYPYSMGFSNVGGSASLSLSDVSGISAMTGNQMSVIAEGKIELKGKKVIIRASKEATVVRKNAVSPTAINLCNAFDAVGKMGNFSSNMEEEKKRERQSPFRQDTEPYSLEGAVSAVLSNIPMEDTGDDPILGKIAAGMPVMSKP